jgi:hypothetical protein
MRHTCETGMEARHARETPELGKGGRSRGNADGAGSSLSVALRNTTAAPPLPRPESAPPSLTSSLVEYWTAIHGSGDLELNQQS